MDNEKEILNYLRDVNADEESFNLFIFSSSPQNSGSDLTGVGRPNFISTDLMHMSLGDWAGSIAGKKDISIQDAEKTLSSFYNNIDYSFGVDNWMQICKVVMESDNSQEILNSYVLKSEEKLYDCISDTNLKPQYSANIIYQLFFNLIRFHVHARKNEFEISKKIIDDLYENWGDIDSQYQYPIVYYKFVYELCSGNFDASTEAFKRFSVILKMTNDSLRHASGIWDDWVSMLIICWFVCSFSMSFEKHFINHLQISESMYFVKRKSILVRRISSQGICDLITKPFYERMRKTFPDVPAL